MVLTCNRCSARIFGNEGRKKGLEERRDGRGLLRGREVAFSFSYQRLFSLLLFLVVVFLEEMGHELRWSVVVGTLETCD